MAVGNNTASSTGKFRDLWELVTGYVLILAVIWTPRPWQRYLYLVTVIFLVIVIWRSFENPRAMGLRTANLLRSSWVVAVALVISGMSIVIARHLHTLHGTSGPLGFIKRYWGYALWSFAQQLLLQDFFLRRFLSLTPGRKSAALAAATIFSLAHLPNPILTIITFLLGLAACFVFLSYRNLYVLAIAHAILGITIALTVPAPLIRNMRVGLGYLTYDRHHFHHAHNGSRTEPHAALSNRYVAMAAGTERLHRDWLSLSQRDQDRQQEYRACAGRAHKASSV
jgi:membrane protease YdiL (CAAX protease family)